MTSVNSAISDTRNSGRNRSGSLISDNRSGVGGGGNWDHIFSFGINLMCHVFILLTFLISFFFAYIAQLTASHISNELKSLVMDQAEDLMQTLDNEDKNKQINWNFVNIMSGNLQQRYAGVPADITYNNQKLFDDCVCVLMIFAFSIIVLVSYFLIRQVNLQLRFIIIENIVIFLFVGLVEVYFFVNIASKYVPVLPDDALIAVIDRLKILLKS